MLKKIKETTQWLADNSATKPRIGIVLGSGLGNLSKKIEVETEIPYSSIPHFPVSTVEGHAGSLIFGKFAGQDIVAMKGRFHYYEGYSMEQIVFPIRVMKMLGIELLILSNAAGGMNPEFSVGDIMLIDDHINLLGTNPLLGKNIDELGPRFPDMSKCYDPALIQSAEEIGVNNGIKLQKGVYAAVTGPTYETPAEYKYIRIIGADAVGMSTIPEVIAAVHMGLKCFATSVITDLGVEGKIEEITHQEVVEAASKSEPKLTSLLENLIKENF